MPKGISESIEAEFNAGIFYAETVAQLLREASNTMIELKSSGGNFNYLVRMVAILKEIWVFVRPFRKMNKSESEFNDKKGRMTMEEILEDIDKLENTVYFPKKSSKAEIINLVKDIDVIRTRVQINAVLSGLIPFKRKMTPDQLLKSALME
jgi:hypothetical protein